MNTRKKNSKPSPLSKLKGRPKKFSNGATSSTKGKDIKKDFPATEVKTDVKEEKSKLKSKPHFKQRERKGDPMPKFNEDEIRAMLRELDIENKWDQKCQFLSMGQQQRVAIVRALCQPFEILLMDEPFSHLDAENALKCLMLIDKRCDEIGAGFVLTTLGDDHGFKYDHIYYL